MERIAEKSAEWDFFTPGVSTDPHPLLAKVRTAGRAVWHETYQSWVVSHFNDILAICRDEKNFTAKDGIVAHNFGDKALLAQDGKLHRALRSAWNAPFLRQSLEALIPRMREISEQLLKPAARQLDDGEVVDFAPLVRALPVEIISILLGVPEQHRSNFARWSDEITHMTGYALPPNHPVEIRRIAAQREVAVLLRAEIARRQVQPQDDLIGRLVACGIEEQIGEEGMVDNCRLLLVAGNETTSNWISNSLVLFDRYPEAQRQIRENRDLLAPALEESLRYDHVAHFAFRRAKSDEARVGNVRIPKGDQVIMIYGAANLDPERFEDPETFDILRDTEGHVGFGHSVHTCMGKELARLEGRTFFEVFLDLVPNYKVVDADYGISFPLRGPQQLLIRKC